MTATELVDPRSQYVKTRLLEINKQASNIIIENGLLLREYLTKNYWQDDGFGSFEQAIKSLQDSGQLDYGVRNARNFIAIVDMVDKLGLDPTLVDELGISKLREIAGLSQMPGEQRRLLDAAGEMSVAEVQTEAKRLRGKASGQDLDPLVAVPFKISETQRGFLMDCLRTAREIYAIESVVPDAVVLVDLILPDWFAGSAQAKQEEARQEVG